MFYIGNLVTSLPKSYVCSYVPQEIMNFLKTATILKLTSFI